MSTTSFSIAQTRVNSVLRQVYLWMTAGLLVTAGTALMVTGTDTGRAIITGNPLIFFGLFIAEIALVIYLVSRIRQMSLQSAQTLFFVYSALNGITIAPILLFYTSASIVSTLFVTAGTFGALSIWALTTKRDLSGWGQYLYIGLFGIIIASVVNIFLGSSRLELLISIIGVIVFMGLTAYDTQIIRRWTNEVPQGGEEAVETRKVAIIGSLKLYLDFINLFLFLLRILGRRR